MISPKSKLTDSYLILISVIVIGLCCLAYLQRQYIRDEITLFGYKPPASVAQLANQAGMTGYTRRVFYVNHPEVVSKQNFSKYCPNSSEQSVVVGCYHTEQNGIYLLAVNNSQLYGIEQVTAAYETLHAIYQRLSLSQQKALNSELTNFEYHGLSDPTIKAQIANFRKTEPGGVLNEMTSLFGTEVQKLPPDLAKFYAPYFKNRQVLLNYYNDYESAFVSRQQQINSDDNQLDSLSSEINANEALLNSQLAQLDSQQASLNGEKASGEISLYNSSVAGYNQQVDAYDSLVAGTKNLIDQYNQILSERNSIAIEEQQLTQAITASPQPITSQ